MSNQNENLPDSQPRLDLPNRNAEHSKSDFGAFEFPDIDGYVIESKLGEGAHGRVFKAIDMSLRKPVAIKVLNPISSGDEHLRERFDRELKAYHSLKDGHIIQLRSYGRATTGAYKNCPYIIMEFMDGGTLGKWMSRFPATSKASLRSSIEILVEVCKGLEYLHEHNIVHRDLKPDNILLAELAQNPEGQPKAGQVRLCDFGLIANLNEDRDLSRTGMGAGTPAYMSPEQFVDSKHITPASDQYAIGVMLYQLLCTRRPWQSSADEPEPQGVLEAELSSKTPCPPPSSSAGKVDARLREICLRCLEPNPTERYENVSHLRESLEAWLNDEIDPHTRSWLKRTWRTRVLHPIRRRPGRFLTAVAALIFMCLGGSWTWYQYAYVWPHVAYYNDIVERWGVFEGIEPIPLSTVRKRPQSYRITSDGWYGPTKFVERINGYERLVQNPDSWNDVWGTDFDDNFDTNKIHKEAKYTYRYKGDGSLDKVAALSTTGVVLWQKIFTSQTSAEYVTTQTSGVNASSTRGISRMLSELKDKNGSRVGKRQDGILATHVEYHYSNSGVKTLTLFSDKDGVPRMNEAGIFGYFEDHDSLGRVTARRFLGENGESTKNDSGFALERFLYEPESGSWSLFSENAIACIGPFGFSIATVKFDSLGRRIKETYFDESGLPATRYDGAHCWIAEYDERGNRTLERFLGTDSKPKKIREGYAELRLTYDDQGRTISTRYFDELGVATVAHDRTHGWEVEYDERGNLKLMRYLNTDGKPETQNLGSKLFLIREADRPETGFAIRSLAYDGFGRQTSERFSDSSGLPTTCNKGYHGWEVEYDERGNRTSLTFIGVDLKPVMLKAGYATIRDSYDQLGRLTSQRYFNDSGTASSHSDGDHGWDAEFDEHGNQVLETYVGVDGKPIDRDFGVAITKVAYDVLGRWKSIFHFNSSGLAATSSDGIHGKLAEYDERGNLTVERYIGTNGKPVEDKDGVAITRSSYDGLMRHRSIRFFDSSDMPTTDSEGKHGIMFEFDAWGNVTEMRHVGVDEELTQFKTGFAIARLTYDSLGREVSRRYFDADGRPATNKENIHEISQEFDFSTNEVIISHRDEDSNLIPHDNGAYFTRKSFDAAGNAISERYFDIGRKPVFLENLGHGVEAEFDARGNRIVQRFIGIDGSPVSLGPFAIIRISYDSKGNQTSHRFFDINDQPTTVTDGIHGWLKEFDEAGNEVLNARIDLEGKPVPDENGVGVTRKSYNASRQMTSIRFFDVDSKPTIHPDYEHGIDTVFDSHGNLIQVCYYGVDGKPQEKKGDGYAIGRSTYDDKRRVTSRRYFNVNDEPTLVSNDSHGEVFEFDEAGNKVMSSLIDIDNKPIPDENGIGFSRKSYDASGRVVTEHYFDKDNNPMLHPLGYHGWIERQDSEANVARTVYIDVDGKPTMTKDGYAEIRSTCDEFGKVNSVRYFDLSGSPAVVSDGSTGWNRVFSDDGLLTEETRFAGPSVQSRTGIAYSRYFYNELGQAVSERHFSNDGDPVVKKGDGEHGWDAKYDREGRLIEKIFVGIAGQPISLSVGYHRWKEEFTSSGETIRHYYDLENNEVQRVGLIVLSVLPDSAAEKCGLRPADRLLSYKGAELYSLSELSELKEKALSLDPSTIRLQIKRGEMLKFLEIEKGPLGAVLLEVYGR